jgi:uroporphyrinogen decarboxylase
MNSLERCAAAIQFKEADRVPVVPIICGASRRVYGISYAEWCQDEELCAKAWIQSQDLFGYDAFVTLVDLSLEAADFGQEVIYPAEDTPHPNYDNPLVTCPDDFVTKIKRIDPLKPGTRMAKNVKMHEILMNEKGKDVAVVAFVYGTLGILSMMRGAEKLFVDCMKHKKEVIAAQEVICQVLEDYIEALGKLGCHSIMLDTLFASGCIMSKRLWKEIEGPFAKRLADKIRAVGSMVSVHNCGNDVYIDAQLEAMEPAFLSYAYLPDDCKSWPEVKAKYCTGPWVPGKNTCLVGHLSPATHLFLGNPDEIKAEAKAEIDVMAKGGGWILAPGCEFPPNGSFINLAALIESAELYGRY